MPGKRTVAVTEEQYKVLIKTIREGFAGTRPNERVASALVVEANIGVRIEDVLQLKLCDIIRDGDRFRLDIVEQKTGKKRTFTVPGEILRWIRLYCIDHEIKEYERIFPITERAVQKILRKAADYLDYQNIGTHSFRKYFATDIYVNNDYNIVLVQRLLQHSSAATTQRYIGISEKAVEDALQRHVRLPE